MQAFTEVLVAKQASYQATLVWLHTEMRSLEDAL